MSLKDDIKAIQEELSAEEKFLESVIKTESFFKKNKKKLIIGGLILIFLILGNVGYDYYKTQKAIKANQLYLSLLEKYDKQKEEELKKLKPKLFELYKFKSSVKSFDPNKIKEAKQVVNEEFLKDLLTYQLASLEQKGLLEYADKKEAVLKEFAYIEAAYLKLKENKIKEAHEILDKISPSSIFYQIAQNLKHYMK